LKNQTYLGQKWSMSFIKQNKKIDYHHVLDSNHKACNHMVNCYDNKGLKEIAKLSGLQEKWFFVLNLLCSLCSSRQGWNQLCHCRAFWGLCKELWFEVERCLFPLSTMAFNEFFFRPHLSLQGLLKTCSSKESNIGTIECSKLIAGSWATWKNKNFIYFTHNLPLNFWVSPFSLTTWYNNNVPHDSGLWLLWK